MSNQIKNLHIRNFRSLAKASVVDCGPLNILIGKNNAGKSSVLAAIPLLFEHLATGRIATSWPVERCSEEFTHRDTTIELQIGIELSLSNSIKKILCDELRTTAPHLGKSIEQLNHENSISFIFRFVYDARSAYQYIESISVGAINYTGSNLSAISTTLLLTPEASAKALFLNFKSTESLQTKISVIKNIMKPGMYSIEEYFKSKRSYPARFILDRSFNDEHQLNPTMRKELTTLLESSDSTESFYVKAAAEIAIAADEIERISTVEIEIPLSTYTGEVKVQPTYLTELCKIYGATPILRLGERKQPIGKKEASRLLQLKVKRGGPEKLQIVQQTVSALLGVSLDAFQGEGGQDSAEIDVDDFLAEANGAGIRESLRLILDLELEPCDIVLLEEPEVHLHPGLEFAVHSYLQEKSKIKQFFVTTHSTNFIDTVSPQHIYLISRNSQGISNCERLAEGDAPIKIPAELGIRLSTVFMFDRIVFVEGSSDESVLREFSRTEGIDLNGAGVTFVHMGGVANFTHYAAQAILDIMSRRKVRMWFIVDRDERDEAEITKMVKRLDGRAKMFVLQRREIENFLIDETAVCSFIQKKTGIEPTREAYQKSLAKVTSEILEEVIKIYVENKLLPPIYLRGQGAEGDPKNRLTVAITTLQERITLIEEESEKIHTDISFGWGIEKALKTAPGALLLDKICKEFNCSFQKSRGDSDKLAKLLLRGAIPQSIINILVEISAPL